MWCLSNMAVPAQKVQLGRARLQVAWSRDWITGAGTSAASSFMNGHLSLKKSAKLNYAATTATLSGNGEEIKSWDEANQAQVWGEVNSPTDKLWHLFIFLSFAVPNSTSRTFYFYYHQKLKKWSGVPIHVTSYFKPERTNGDIHFLFRILFSFIDSNKGPNA